MSAFFTLNAFVHLTTDTNPTCWWCGIAISPQVISPLWFQLLDAPALKVMTSWSVVTGSAEHRGVKYRRVRVKQHLEQEHRAEFGHHVGREHLITYSSCSTLIPFQGSLPFQYNIIVVLSLSHCARSSQTYRVSCWVNVCQSRARHC